LLSSVPDDDVGDFAVDSFECCPRRNFPPFHSWYSPACKVVHSTVLKTKIAPNVPPAHVDFDDRRVKKDAQHNHGDNLYEGRLYYRSVAV
jgi:hypothetical protein